MRWQATYRIVPVKSLHFSFDLNCHSYLAFTRFLFFLMFLIFFLKRKKIKKYLFGTFWQSSQMLSYKSEAMIILYINELTWDLNPCPDLLPWPLWPLWPLWPPDLLPWHLWSPGPRLVVWWEPGCCQRTGTFITTESQIFFYFFFTFYFLR